MKTKRVISVFLSLTILICSISIGATAFAGTKSIKSVINSSKTWTDIGKDDDDLLTVYKFGKDKKVTVIVSNVAETRKRTVKYKISKNKIKFSYNLDSCMYNITLSIIEGSNLLKATQTTDDTKYVTLLDKGRFTQSADTKLMKNIGNSSWNAPSLKKKYSSFQKLVVYQLDGTYINGYIKTANGNISFYGVTNTRNTIKLQINENPDTYIIERMSNSNKLKVFIFKNASNKYTTETWTKIK